MSIPFSRLAPLASSVVLLGALALPAYAESPEAARIRELEKKLERSMQLIEDLSKKVQHLERSSVAPTAPAQGKLDELQQQIHEIAVARSSRAGDDSLPVHGFADIGMVSSGQNNPTDGRGNKGFTVGSLDLYLTPQFGDRVKALVELVFEVDGDTTILDLERAQIGYSFSDAATGWLGRFHTPYGYWNTAFHHGQQIQTSVTRPRFLDFEDAGGILPAHTVGTWLTGSLPMAGNKLGYDVYWGNSPRIQSNTLDMKMSGHSSHYPSLGFNVALRPADVRDLTVGLHGLRAKVQGENANAVLTSETRLSMLGAYAVFQNDNWELMSEYYRFRNRDLMNATGTHGSSAWYAQAGYTFNALTPYARLERTRLDQMDGYFADQTSGRSYRRVTAGLRYDLDPKAALKFEFNRTRKEDLGLGVPDDKFSEARVQYSIRF